MTKRLIFKGIVIITKPTFLLPILSSGEGGYTLKLCPVCAFSNNILFCNHPSPWGFIRVGAYLKKSWILFGGLFKGGYSRIQISYYTALNKVLNSYYRDIILVLLRACTLQNNKFLILTVSLHWMILFKINQGWDEVTEYLFSVVRF